MQVDRATIRDRASKVLGKTPGARALLTPAKPTLPHEPLPTDTGEVVSLLKSERFGEDVARLAEQLDMSRDDAMSEAAGYLREMATTHDPKVTEWWGRLGHWLTRGYDVLVDDDGLNELRRLDRKHSLIFLISHRSYLDEFILPPVLSTGDLSPLFGAAGANLDFFPMGTVARRTGIIHVRRATADIPIYRLALRSYFGQLVANKSNMCWAIEGGRTRTGKLRPPRYGLLRYVTDAAEAVPEADPLLVPVSFMYDQLPVHEIGKMADEARGQTKQKEDFRWLIHYAAGLRERLGRVYLDFGEPLPLLQRMAELRADEVTENLVERVALDISHRINDATPITPTATVCIALLAAGRALTLDEVLTTVQPLADYVHGRGWPVAGGATLTDRSTLRWALRELVRSGVLICYQGAETVWTIGPDQHLIAAVYRNSAIHVLLLRAIAELALQAVAESGEERGETAPKAATDEALRLRELLKFDFFFAQREQFIAEIGAEIEILARPDQPSGVEVTPDQAAHWLRSARPLVSHLVLRPFLDAYRVVAEQLDALDDDEAAETEPFVEACLRVGHQWALQHTLASEESVSGEMFRTALKLAAFRDLVKPGAPHLGKRRREFAEEVVDVAKAIGRIEEYDQTASH